MCVGWGGGGGGEEGRRGGRGGHHTTSVSGSTLRWLPTLLTLDYRICSQCSHELSFPAFQFPKCSYESLAADLSSLYSLPGRRGIG